MSDQDEITMLLAEASDGESAAVEKLYPLVYDELRRLAQSHLASERRDHTLEATALVHEAYLKMVDQTRAQWKNRSQFFAVAAQAMRRILVDHARGKRREKRGGGVSNVTLDRVNDLVGDGPSTDLVALDEALERLSQEDAHKAQVVELRFFGGLSNKEIAELLDVSTRTVERHWQYARAWLYRELAN